MNFPEDVKLRLGEETLSGKTVEIHDAYRTTESDVKILQMMIELDEAIQLSDSKVRSELFWRGKWHEGELDGVTTPPTFRRIFISILKPAATGSAAE